MIYFNEETHEYYNGLDKLMSVTQLLKKHGLSTDFSAVPQHILNKASEKGTAIHKRIENYVNTGEVGEGEYQEQVEMFALTFPNKYDISEVVVGNDIVGGKVDLIDSTRGMLSDVKTGSTQDVQGWTWQTSIYEYLYRMEHGTNPMNISAIPLTETSCELIPLNNIQDEEIERLFECERNGELYKQQVIPSDLALKVEQAEQSLAIVENAKKQAEEVAKQYRAELLEYMENNGIKQFKGDKVTVTYVAPQVRSGYDMKALELHHSDILHLYPKNTKVKASLRVTVHE